MVEMYQTESSKRIVQMEYSLWVCRPCKREFICEAEALDGDPFYCPGCGGEAEQAEEQAA